MQYEISCPLKCLIVCSSTKNQARGPPILGQRLQFWMGILHVRKDCVFQLATSRSSNPIRRAALFKIFFVSYDRQVAFLISSPSTHPRWGKGLTFSPSFSFLFFFVRWASCSVDLLKMGVFKSEVATFASNSFYFITTNERPGPSCSKAGQRYPSDKFSIQWISIREANCTIHWIEMYPVDSAIHLWNNCGQMSFRAKP